MEVKPKRLEYVDQTHTSLLDAAERQFVVKGYAATSLDAVAAEARFTKGAVYRHFANKEAVFVAVLQRIQRQAVQRLSAPPSDPPTWQDATTALAAYLDLSSEPVFRRVVIEQAPGVLGWERFRALDEQATGAVLHHALERLHTAGILVVPNPALTARMLCALVAEAAIGLANTPQLADDRASYLNVLEQLLSGLRPPTCAAGDPARHEPGGQR